MNVAERVARLVRKFSNFRCGKTATGGWKVVVNSMFDHLDIEWFEYRNSREFLLGSDEHESIFKIVKLFGDLKDRELFCSLAGCSLEEIAMKLDLLGFDD